MKLRIFGGDGQITPLEQTADDFGVDTTDLEELADAIGVEELDFTDRVTLLGFGHYDDDPEYDGSTFANHSGEFADND